MVPINTEEWENLKKKEKEKFFYNLIDFEVEEDDKIE